jgi:hypothetical protein
LADAIVYAVAGAPLPAGTLAGRLVRVTVCCGVDFRLPAASARARSRCTASSTSLCCARKASPRSCVHLIWSFIIASVCGTAVSALTLGSQLCFCMASSSA